jgi:hypothetical protein
MRARSSSARPSVAADRHTSAASPVTSTSAIAEIAVAPSMISA